MSSLDGFDLGSSQDWNLILRVPVQRQTGADGRPIPIPARTFSSPTALVAVGLFNTSLPSRWYTGGFVSLCASISFGSTGVGLPLLQLVNERIPINRYALIQFDKVLPSPYIGIVSFPDYLEGGALEIWYNDTYT